MGNVNKVKNAMYMNLKPYKTVRTSKNQRNFKISW